VEGEYKKFSKRLFDTHDAPARTLSKMILEEQMGYRYAADHTDTYGPDLICEDDWGVRKFIECEVKNNWSGPQFPFDSVQVPERKRKFCRIPNLYFMMFNKEMDHFIWMKGADILTSPLVEVKNKFTPSGELFFQVPLIHTKIIRIVRRLGHD